MPQRDADDWERTAMTLAIRLEDDGKKLVAGLSRGANPEDSSEAEKAINLKIIEALIGEMKTLLHRATRWGEADQGTYALLRRNGELLFDRMLPAAIKEELRRESDPSLRLLVDPQLRSVPFELMHTGQAFLGARFAVGRVQTKGDQEGTHLASGSAGDGDVAVVGRALVVCDPRGDLIGAYHEGLVVRDALTTLGFLTDLRSTEVTTTDLLRMLRDYDLVHFAGHGERPDSERGGGARGWWLKDDVLTAELLRELAGGRPLPRVVFSNACRSARESSDARQGESLAQTMLALGTDVFIGTTCDVPDEVAGLFALSFYGALANGVGAGEAMCMARAALVASYGATSVHGAAWVLHGEPDAVIAREPVIEVPLVGQPVLEVGARVRGAAPGVLAPVFAIGPVGATRGQALLATLGALTLVALLVALVLSAMGSPHGETQLRTDDGAVEVVPMKAPGSRSPRLEDGPMRRAHPVEYQPVSPLPATTGGE